MIKSVCVYCQTVLGYKADDSSIERISHGICSLCLKKMLGDKEILSVDAAETIQGSVWIPEKTE